MPFFLVLAFLVFLAYPSATFAKEPSRLSAIVSFLTNTPPIAEWLKNLGSHSYVEAYALFPPETGNDVIFGIDQEFLDGTSSPAFIKGGDWMGLVGIQRTGVVWVAKGTDDTMRGKPSSDRAWEIIPLGSPLKPDTWYRLRTVIDFKNRRYVSFRISGPGIDRKLDLKKFTLDYPNYTPFDQRALTSYTFSMRGKSMMQNEKSKARIYFDDVSVGLTGPAGDRRVFFDNFENNKGRIPKQDISFMTLLGGIKIKSYKEGQWYLERKESLSRVLRAPFARSGSKIAVCDATLQSTSYNKWFKTW